MLIYLDMYKLLVKSFLLLLVFSSCSKIVDIDIPDNEKHIDVIGLMNSDSILKVNISKSVSILQSTEVSYFNNNSSNTSNIDFVSNATVKIYENNVYKDTLSFTEYGNYIANFKPVVGNTYKIEVDVPNCEQVDAENNIPEKVEILSIDTSNVSNDSFGDDEDILRCEITFSDPPDVENYYLLNVSGKITYSWYDEYDDSLYVMVDSSFIDFDTNDPIIDQDAKIDNAIIFNDDVINGKTYTLNIEIDKYYSDSTMLYFNLFSVSRDYYLYRKSISMQKYGGGPFTEAVTVYTNINNGVGIFAGTNKSTYSILARNTDYNY
ncbi:MAG: hypothetical protein DRJ01_08895 [Bacteroidetes bacterium]|nr:MAG: hypothetical protein DRJ01_08895 [Bacteroidota bacterium]